MQVEGIVGLLEDESTWENSSQAVLLKRFVVESVARTDTDADDTRECSICWSAFLGAATEPHSIVQLACGHTFHLPCAGRWLIGCGRSTCPSCRARVDLAPQPAPLAADVRAGALGLRVQIYPDPPGHLLRVPSRAPPPQRPQSALPIPRPAQLRAPDAAAAGPRRATPPPHPAPSARASRADALKAVAEHAAAALRRALLVPPPRPPAPRPLAAPPAPGPPGAPWRPAHSQVVRPPQPRAAAR